MISLALDERQTSSVASFWKEVLTQVQVIDDLADFVIENGWRFQEPIEEVTTH